MSKDPETIVYEILEKVLEFHSTPEQREALRNRDDLTFEDLALTSLHTVEIPMELEDNLGVYLEENEFADVKRISDLVKLVQSRM